MPFAPPRRAALSGLLCALTLLSPRHAGARAWAETDPVLERVRRAVVLIVTHDESGQTLLRGSGFFVGRGRVVTSLHVLRGARGARVLTHDGKGHRVGAVACASVERDLVLLEVDSRDESYAPLEVERATPRAGDEVAVVGGAGGAGPRATRGAAGGLWYVRGAGELIQITARIAGGDSGGPVVNRAGRVVGVAALFAESSEDLNFAVTSDAIVTLMSQAARRRSPEVTPRRAASADVPAPR